MIRLPRLPENATRILFVCSLCLLFLLYGIAAGHYEFFPFNQLRDSGAAAKALIEVFTSDDREVAIAEGQELRVRRLSATDDGALILVGGGQGYLKSLNPAGGCVAWLMDRDGDVKHFWKYDPAWWDDLQFTSTVPGQSSVYPVGVYMLDDGGLLVSFQGFNTWPFAIGFARLDKDSNLIWIRECHAHHWFDVTSDNRIITPTLRILDEPQQIGSTHGRIRGLEGRILEDVITMMSLDGEVLEEHSLLDAVHDSGLVGLYQGAFEQTIDVDTTDPLHLNFIRVVGDDVAAQHDWLGADDLLISCRSVNSIMILDRQTMLVKWVSSGSTLRQHCPIFRDSENILVFDNHGGDQSLGRTRIAEINLDTRLATTVFPTADQPPPSAPSKVFSPSAGHLDLNAEGDAVLMTVSGQSRVLEVDLNTSAVIWEYDHPKGIYTARYCYNASFEMNHD